MKHVDPANEGTRITVVYYFRKNLCECETVQGELDRARMRFGDVNDPAANRWREVDHDDDDCDDCELEGEP
jgi:hypothetical protein